MKVVLIGGKFDTYRRKALKKLILRSKGSLEASLNFPRSSDSTHKNK